jgi:hypothetical protein
MSKAVQQFLELAKQVKSVELLRHCRVCSKVVAHLSVQRGIQETLTCLRCGHEESHNTK